MDEQFDQCSNNPWVSSIRTNRWPQHVWAPSETTLMCCNVWSPQDEMTPVNTSAGPADSEARGSSYIFADLVWNNAAALKHGGRSLPGCVCVCPHHSPRLFSGLLLPVYQKQSVSSGPWSQRLREILSCFQSAGCFHRAAQLLCSEEWQSICVWQEALLIWTGSRTDGEYSTSTAAVILIHQQLIISASVL